VIFVKGFNHAKTTLKSCNPILGLQFMEINFCRCFISKFLIHAIPGIFPHYVRLSYIIERLSNINQQVFTSIVARKSTLIINTKLGDIDVDSKTHPHCSSNPLDRQFGVRDRSRASTSHGNAKMIGELPEGVAIDSPEGEAFLMLLRTMHEALPYGIRPAGSKTEMMVNQSASWQIFKEIIDSRLGDAARVYLGHDGTIRAAGGNYIKDGYLFGVSADIVEADLRTLERGFFEGVLQPWTALNFGDSSLAPMRRWLMPDADEDTRRASIAERRTKFWADLAAARAAGVVVDQAFVIALAEEFGVRAPQLADAAPLPTPEAAQPDGGEVQASEAPTDEAAAHLAAKMTEAGLERCEHQRSNRCWMCGIERVRDFEVVDGVPTWKVAWRPIGDVSVTAASPTFLS
jgi:hypothetical protein